MFTKPTCEHRNAIGSNRFRKSLWITNDCASAVNISAVIISAAILAQCAIAQGQNNAKKDNQDDLKNTTSVFVPADRDLRRVLDGARQAMEEKRYSDAISSLNELINPSQADRSEMEDFFLGTGEGELPRIAILPSRAHAAEGTLAPAHNMMIEIRKPPAVAGAFPELAEELCEPGTPGKSAPETPGPVHQQR